MQENNAPEKLYLNQNEGLIWHCRSYKDDIEYIRTDAIIEKACEWLRENKDKYLYNTGSKGEYIPTCSDRMIDDFKKYMKDE
jgi:hypothetical protein